MTDGDGARRIFDFDHRNRITITLSKPQLNAIISWRAIRALTQQQQVMTCHVDC